jgi:hypothetical protein
MYCYNCGQEIVADNYKYCPNCGLNLKESISKNQTVNFGNNSVNIGGNGDNQYYHIGQLNYNTANQKELIEYKCK